MTSWTSLCNDLIFYIDIQKQERARTRRDITHGIRFTWCFLVLLQVNIDTQINNKYSVKTRGMVRNNALYYNTRLYIPATLPHTTQSHTTPHHIIHYTTLNYTTLHYSTLQCNTTQCNAIKCNAIQYNTIQYHTTLHLTTLHCTVLYFPITKS